MVSPRDYYMNMNKIWIRIFFFTFAFAVVQMVPLEHHRDLLYEISSGRIEFGPIHRGSSIHTSAINNLINPETPSIHPSKLYKAEDVDYHENRVVQSTTHRTTTIEDESLRVVPLNKNGFVEIKEENDSNASRERRRVNRRRNIYRQAIGGYGVGWRYGGHGAGHGFYLHS